MNKRKIYVLLTRFPDKGAFAIGVLTKSYYTHASIGLEEDLNTFYSFVKKGFREEKMQIYVDRNEHPFPCQLYEISVSEKVYQKARETLLKFSEHKKEYSYSNLGLILGLFHIPHRFSKHYFCSQFVSEILKSCEVVPLKKHCSQYMPADFRNIKELKLVLEGNLKTLLQSNLATCNI